MHQPNKCYNYDYNKKISAHNSHDMWLFKYTCSYALIHDYQHTSWNYILLESCNALSQPEIMHVKWSQ